MGAIIYLATQAADARSPAFTGHTRQALMLALLWKSLADKMVRCELCAHYCRIAPGRTGICAVRANVDGELVSLVSDGVRVANVDPVEKKPLYHYLPHSRTFSIGTEGCNLSCQFCQNAELAHGARSHPVRSTPASPAAIVAAAREAGCASIAFTYNEPTVFFELMHATAEKALQEGLGTLMVSNGYQSPACLEALEHRIQAANIDLKSMSETTYRTVCGAHLAPVLDNLRHMAAMGWWLEVTTLLIEGVNDSAPELESIATFIAGELGQHVPWHISAFFPCYQMKDHPPTSQAALERALGIGRAAGLHFVYTGNAGISQPTRCPACGTVHIERHGPLGMIKNMPPKAPYGTCTHCGHAIAGVWKNA